MWPCVPFTLFVNKAFIEGERHAALTWGAAHAGVAAGVMDAVAEGTVPAAGTNALLLIAAVWVNPRGVRRSRPSSSNNRDADLRGAPQRGAGTTFRGRRAGGPPRAMPTRSSAR